MFRLFVSCFDGERNLEDCSQLFSAKENLKMATIRKEGSWRRWKRVTLKPGRDSELGKYKRFKFISVHQDLSDMIIYLCALVASIDKNLWLSPWGESVLSGSSTCIRVKLCIPE